MHLPSSHFRSGPSKVLRCSREQDPLNCGVLVGETDVGSSPALQQPMTEELITPGKPNFLFLESQGEAGSQKTQRFSETAPVTRQAGRAGGKI